VSEFDEDPWPHPPPLLEDPSSFGSAWWRRLGTILLAIGSIAYVGVLVLAVLAYWRSGEVNEYLIRGVGVTLIALLLWLGRLREGRSGK
jgi:hypothetical protein